MLKNKIIFAGLFACKIIFATMFQDLTQELFSELPSKGWTASWADLNNDGYPDLIANGEIFRNNQGKSFTKIAIDDLKKSGSVIVADFNGDGIPDLFFPDKYLYYLGQGDFKFIKKDLPTLPKHISLGASAADFDNDGYLDIYLSGYEIWAEKKSFPDYFLKNNKGEFSITWQTPKEQIMRCHGGLTACDFNFDGKMELYVGNYRLQENFLWFNLGTNKPIDKAIEFNVAGGRRKDVTFTTEHGIKYYSSGHTISTVWGDFDNDGYFDLFVGNLSHPPAYQDRCQFLKNLGPEQGWKFTDMSKKVNLRWQESIAGAAAGDYNNDGKLDIFITTIYPRDKSVLLKNNGDWNFTEDTQNIESVTTYQAAWGDFDRDGKLDLFTNGKLYRNIGASGDYLQVQLVGASPNSSAIGARVTLKNKQNIQVRQVETSTGAGGQNDSTLHFGLGKENTQEVELEIVWPNGKKEKQNVKTNQLIKIKQN